MSDSPRSVPDWLTRLIADAKVADAAPPFSDQSLVDYRMGARELVTIGEDAAALVALDQAEFVVAPDARRRGLGTRLLEQLLASGSTLFWAHGDAPGARELAASHGLAAVRQLLHFVGPVPELNPVPEQQPVPELNPVPELVEGPPADTGSGPSTSSGTDTRSGTATPSGTDTRLGTAAPSGTDTSSGTATPSGTEPFRVGHDEDEWVALNARTFAHHPEQGAVTRVDLEQLESEPWFSADNFLVIRRDGRMIGYCWLKVEDGRGEFYVVGVDPHHHGEKLGSLLFDAGLARLAKLGIRSSHLYVEGDNVEALRLYRSRGFTQDSIDIQYSLS